MEETILEGHLGVTKELLAFQTPEKKYYIGCENGGANLIKVDHTKSPEADHTWRNTPVITNRSFLPFFLIRN